MAEQQQGRSTQFECKSLYVGNLSPHVTQPLLAELFAGVGGIINVKTQASLGYGFVDFQDHSTAERAMMAFNGRVLYGQDLRINWASAAGREDTSQHHNIFVGDLSPEIEDAALWDAFATFGSISDARVMRDPAAQRSRGYGFVSFREHADAQNAINHMNGQWLGSRAIRCNWANQKNNTKSTQSRSADYESVLYQTPKSNSTVYVGNIAPETTEMMLRAVLSEYGQIEEVRMQSEKGFAFVKYSTHQNAADAIARGIGKIIGMRTIRISWGKEKSETDRTKTAQPALASPYPMHPYMPGMTFDPQVYQQQMMYYAQQQQMMYQMQLQQQQNLPQPLYLSATEKPTTTTTEGQQSEPPRLSRASDANQPLTGDSTTYQPQALAEQNEQ